MTLPGFNAETSLYKTSVHYRSMGAPVQADGVVPQQVRVFCGTCHLDDTGACVQNCTICGPRFCHFFGTFPCAPSACPQADPCGCRHRCCPSGICQPGVQQSCFIECITFCGQ